MGAAGDDVGTVDGCTGTEAGMDDDQDAAGDADGDGDCLEDTSGKGVAEAEGLSSADGHSVPWPKTSRLSDPHPSPLQMLETPPSHHTTPHRPCHAPVHMAACLGSLHQANVAPLPTQSPIPLSNPMPPFHL